MRKSDHKSPKSTLPADSEEPIEVIVEPRTIMPKSPKNSHALASDPSAISQSQSALPSQTPSASDKSSKFREALQVDSSISQENSSLLGLKETDPPSRESRRSLAPKKKSHDSKTRVVNINGKRHDFASNFVKTSKYSFVTFIPYFIYEQFRRYSNIFFLFIVLLQQIPDVSPTGKYTTAIPLVFILSVSAIKEIIEDRKRHKADEETNNRLISVLKASSWEQVKWSNVRVGDFVKVKNNMMFPADLVLYSSSEPLGMCYIETSNLDGETNLKVRQSLPETSEVLETQDFVALTGFIECELPNRHLYEFVGTMQLGLEEENLALALGPNQVLLRGTKLQNTNWIIGQVIYTGHETKLLKNSTKAPLKRSTLDKLTNRQIIMLFILLIICSLTSALFSLLLFDENKTWYLPASANNENQSAKGKTENFFYSALTFLILYNNLIPISLTVTLEVVRFFQAMFINNDRDMYYAETDTPAMARTSNLNEELGIVRYIFSDKTGTLTRNVMEFKGCTVGGEMYEPDFYLQEPISLIENLKNGHKTVHEIREFLVILSVCHTVIPEHSDTGELIYNASSPDESALVYGASKLGYVFQTRAPNHVEMKALNVLEKYEVLNVLEFTSTRKRMSVLVRGPDNKIRLYCKGADSVIYERLSAQGNSEVLKQKTLEHLDIFATQGLRTLCLAFADISNQAYEDWKKIYHKASTAIQDRELKLEEASNLIETNLRLVGATAIEDKLQDKVPETIAALLKAGISVWVLTGDKQETAINIGYSSRLLSQSMELLMINHESFESTRDCIMGYIDKLSGESKALPEESDAAVIIDGKSLTYALNTDLRRSFIELCCSCRSVIVCRASPMQKAEIVEYVTHQTGEITLAIGDGANDVAMIQKAHVGVGISGMEGLQASSASDYAIGQFHFLAKLLFVHGAWNYDRMCKLIFFSFYKNICLYIIELWFAIYSGWSGQIIFERWTIGFYNMLFTSAQPIAMGLFERQCSAELRMKYPILYRQNKNAFTLNKFFFWIGNAILHSISLFWLTKLAVGDGVVWSSGFEGSYLILGNFIYTYVVIVVSLKAGIETKSWTFFSHLAIWGSIVLWVVFLILYSLFWLTLPLGEEMLGIAWMVFSSPVFWIALLFIPTLTLLPDIVFKAVQNSMFQSVDDQYREYSVMQRKTEVKI